MRTGLGCLLLLLTVGDAWALDAQQMQSLLRQIDERQSTAGDYKALVYIEQKERGKENLLYEAVTYRRDEDDKFMMMFLKPKAEAGKGYLRLDNNLFFYDPTVGKWERRTERERIAGTNSRRNDFDESRLAQEFTPTYVAQEKLGRFGVHHLKLRAKEGADVPYPVLHIWVDVSSGNLLKREEYALSGRLIRTSYFPRWARVKHPKTGEEVFFPKEMRVYDELEKGNSTTIVVRKVDLGDLDANMFTKAWLESKSR